MEIMRLHYKDEKVFPFEKYVTKLKENFRVLEKDKSERRTEKQQVHTMLHGRNTSDVGIKAAKTTVFHSHQKSFDKAVHFMSAYISNRHAGAQADYASRHGGGRTHQVSAAGSDDTRGGRGSGRGRGGRGRGTPRRTYANNVDITDPHRNFTSAEWEKLGTMRSYVLQLRDGGGKVATMAEATQRIDQLPVLMRVAQPVELLPPAITTMPPQETPTTRLCLTLQNEAHKMAAASAAVPTIIITPQHDPRRPVATVQSMARSRVHVALGCTKHSEVNIWPSRHERNRQSCRHDLSRPKLEAS